MSRIDRHSDVILDTQPITFEEACVFVDLHHKHHVRPQGHKFSIAVHDCSKVVGVIIVGRPVSRYLDDNWTLEVTRCCTDGSAPNIASKLYGAAWKTTVGLGYKRLVTYTLFEELGTSIGASGFDKAYTTDGKSWNVPKRKRIDKHPLGKKQAWFRTVRHALDGRGRFTVVISPIEQLQLWENDR